MIFGPNSAPSRSAAVAMDPNSTLVRKWEAAKANWQNAPRGRSTVGLNKKKKKKKKKARKSKSRDTSSSPRREGVNSKKKTKKKKNRSPKGVVVGHQGVAVPIPASDTWVNRGEIDMDTFRMPTWDDVRKIETNMGTVRVPKWHHAVIRQPLILICIQMAPVGGATSATAKEPVWCIIVVHLT